MESAYREIEEEWWLAVDWLELFGHIKKTAKIPKPNRNRWFYPFPHSYGLYYIGITSYEPWDPICELIEKAEFLMKNRY